jgi:hypothetical protein
VNTVAPLDVEPLYIYFIDGYTGPVKTTEVRPGLIFDTAPDNRLIGIEVLDYERLTVDGQTVRAAGEVG